MTTTGSRSPGTRFPGLVLVALAVFLPIFSGGCASERYARPSAGLTQRGMASWYGSEFHGKPTASGETYDMNLLTAAHRELPLQTLVEVENLDNGRKVRVRINDRGPFVRGRILDLSYGAARELDMVGTGLARVEVRIVEVGSGIAGPSRFSRYTVQLGAFRDKKNAAKVRARAAADFPEAQILTEDGWHRVRVGLFSQRSDAADVARKLKRRGLDAIVVPIS